MRYRFSVDSGSCCGRIVVVVVVVVVVVDVDVVVDVNVVVVVDVDVNSASADVCESERVVSLPSRSKRKQLSTETGKRKTFNATKLHFMTFALNGRENKFVSVN